MLDYLDRLLLFHRRALKSVGCSADSSRAPPCVLAQQN